MIERRYFMKIYEMKGRTELAGTVSGQLYCFMEGEKKYYYLVNILNSKDIHIVKPPKREQLKEMDESKVDDYLKQFHLTYLETGGTNSDKMIKQPKNVENIEQLLLQKRHEELTPYYVEDWDATEFLISKLGKIYEAENVKSVYNSRHVQIYEIPTEKEKIKFIIRKTYTKKGIGKSEYTLISVAEEKKQYEEKMKRLIAGSGVTWDIAKIFINLAADEEKITSILKVIQSDKISGEYKDGYTWWNAYKYCSHLETVSDYSIIVTNEDKQKIIYDYVSQK